MSASEAVCPSCGERNAPGTEFCTSCNTYLAWDPTMVGHPLLDRPAIPDDATAVIAAPSGQPPARRPGPPVAAAPGGPRPLDVIPRSPSPPPPGISRIPRLGGPPPSAQRPPERPGRPAGPPASAGPAVADPAPVRSAPLLKAVVEPSAITVTPGEAPARIDVKVFNLSTVVDGYTIELQSPPSFLQVDTAELRLLPNTDGSVQLTVGVPLVPLVPADVHRLTVAIRSSTQPGLVVTELVVLTVGVIVGPIALTVEPSLIRVRDSTDASFRLLAENLTGNRAVPLTLEGSDPEGLVRFTFVPPGLTVPPGGRATAVVQLHAPAPDPGHEVSRQLTLTATEGTREVLVTATMIQATTLQEVTLTLEPSLVKIRDVGVAHLRVIAANLRGSRPVQITLQGSDPESAVRFGFSHPVLIVQPGGTATAGVQLQVPEPEPGQEISRSFTISASDGRTVSTVAGTLQQSTSPVALSVWLEPSLIRVRDSVIGQSQVVADNRQSRRPLRLSLSGSDPERAVRFVFNPPVLDVAAGQMASSYLQLEAAEPEDGREAARPITVVAATDVRTVEATGTFVQTSSAPAISALNLRLDPSVIRVANSADASFNVVGDNREGTAPVQVYLDGSDSERVAQFYFEPQVLHIPPGGWALARATVRAPRPDRGKEVTRQIRVTASDDRRTVEAGGSYIQTSSDPRPRIRILLTLLGTALMTAGVFGTWTNVPKPFNGMKWSLLEFADAIKVDLRQFNFRIAALREIDAAIQSAGLVILLFTALTLFGLTGTKGRLTRTGAVLALVFMIAFFVALMVRADDWDIGIGAIAIVVGAITAFIGGLFGRR